VTGHVPFHQVFSLDCRFFQHHTDTFLLLEAAMSIVLSPSKLKPKPVFPATALETGLRAELIEIVKSSAEFHGHVLPSTPAAIVTFPYPIDSLDVVGILCKLDELVGYDLPHHVVRAGGYNSIDEALHHMMPRIKASWLKRNGGTA
jgi:hypothetical protein